ncbi:MAG: hypothetical protein V8T46_07080, partial [Sutterella seckii]
LFISLPVTIKVFQLLHPRQGRQQGSQGGLIRRKNHASTEFSEIKKMKKSSTRCTTSSSFCS